MVEPRDRNTVKDRDDVANHPGEQVTGGAQGSGKKRQGERPGAGKPESDQASVVAPTPRSVKQLPAGQGTDPTKQDQQSGQETNADRTVDRGDADRAHEEMRCSL